MVMEQSVGHDHAEDILEHLALDTAEELVFLVSVV